MTNQFRPPLTPEDFNPKMPEQIVKFSGDEGRDRATSPSINAPHTQLEALVAVLMELRCNAEAKHKQYSGPHPEPGYPFAPPASDTQRAWVAQSYADAAKMLTERIEWAQSVMRKPAG
jgi:hypothetical protein